MSDETAKAIDDAIDKIGAAERMLHRIGRAPLAGVEVRVDAALSALVEARQALDEARALDGAS